MKTTTANEEGATLLVPDAASASTTNASDPFHKLAFYNPLMTFNRTVSSIALGASGVKGNVLDGLCATGARGVRYAKENQSIEKVFFVDANEHAAPLCKANIKQNKVNGELVSNELNAFLCYSGEDRPVFDWIELDPFGSPVPFLDSSLRRIQSQKQGILSVTATDLAKLCGAEAKKCMRHYDAMPLRNHYCHETALRILLGKICRMAAAYDLAPVPLVSFFQGHAVKTICRIEPSAKKADECLAGLGYVHDAGAERDFSKLNKWESNFAGPLWLGETSDKAFLEKMKSINQDRSYSNKQIVDAFIAKLIGETAGFPPWHWDVHEIASKLNTHAPRTEAVFKALTHKGFAVAPSHYKPTSFKTDATLEEIRDCWPK